MTQAEREALDSLVRHRARERCEYCGVPQAARRITFQLDHIIAEQHGGMAIETNLALACPDCNRRKGPNLSGVDPTSGDVVRLFDPRTQSWTEHFVQKLEGSIEGRTPCGRATVRTLGLNQPLRIALRRELLVEGMMESMQQ